MNNEETYPENWVRLNLMMNPKTGEMNATGGDLNDGPEGCDVGYKGFDALQKMIKPSINAIYTVTTIRNMSDVRCIGYYFEAKHTIEEVLNNSCDMCECGNYPYCVVEEIKPGLYYYPRIEIWFEWNYEKEMYIKIDEKPEEFKNVGGFALG
jgi:hypothetical protein